METGLQDVDTTFLGLESFMSQVRRFGVIFPTFNDTRLKRTMKLNTCTSNTRYHLEFENRTAN